MNARVISLCLLCAAALCPSLFAAESDATPPPAGATEPGAAVEAPKPAPDEKTPEGPPGDVVTLKNGRQYRGFQVLRATAAEVELEVTETVTIKIPRRQIVSIAYDEIDPVAEREKKKSQDAAGGATAALLSGQRVSPELQKKLEKNISEPPLTVDKRDLVDVVNDLNPRTDNALEVAQPVKDLPAEKRVWSFSTKPGMTLDALLKEEFAKSFPHLATLYQNDKVVITTRDAALFILTAENNKNAAAPPPAPEAAAPAPAGGAATPPPAAPAGQ